MADVFISYAKADGFIAEGLATDLQLRGYDIWWDLELYAGDRFHDAIRAQIAKSKVVIVIWSKDAIGSPWVLGEAQEAADLGKLIATHVPGFDVRRVPLNFRAFHMENVEDRDRIVRVLKRNAVSNVRTEWQALSDAVASGNRDAQRKLGTMYMIGRGVPQDFRESARLFRLAAEQGDIDAQVNLAFHYMDGRGVPKSFEEAACLLRRAAEQGDAEAQTYLSICYRDGRGVPQDSKVALWLARLAAEQGHPHGQFNLGMICVGERGCSASFRQVEGFEPNFEEGVRLLTLAADQGHQLAWKELSSIYRDSSNSSTKARLERYAADVRPTGPTKPVPAMRRYGGGWPWVSFAEADKNAACPPLIMF